MSKIDYNLISQSIFYYQLHGFKYIDVDWLVDLDIGELTLPEEKIQFCITPRGEIKKTLVGSAEQSFLQLVKDKKLDFGKYVSVTGCFRDDPIDELHQPYFMKTELFMYDTLVNLEKEYDNIVNICLNFSKQYVPVKIKKMTPKDDKCIQCDDIVTVKDEIELGSYGIATNEVGGKKIYWIYATGMASQRLNTIYHSHHAKGYHNAIIPKSLAGCFSKILEEVEELKDAIIEKNKIMELVELSDLYGAIELYIEQKHGMTMNDLKIMSDTTKRAFKNGQRE